MSVKDYVRERGPMFYRLCRHARPGDTSLLRTKDELPQHSETHIYIIRAEYSGAVKIGRAHNVASRMQTLQTGSHEPLRLMFAFPAPKHAEKRIHHKLRAHRIRGEWFKGGKDFDAKIAALVVCVSIGPQFPVIRGGELLDMALDDLAARTKAAA